MAKQDLQPAYIPGFIYGALWALDRKITKDTPLFSSLYLRLYNPVNYALVGGIGIIINFVVNWVFLNVGFDWRLANLLAIIFAWSFNWSMSVGPLGWLWGFKKRIKKDDKVRET